MTKDEAIEKVIDAFSAWESEYDTGDDWSAEHEACEMAVEALAKEPVHGKWIYEELYEGWPSWICTVCGMHGRGDYNYCPWCGAKMYED